MKKLFLLIVFFLLLIPYRFQAQQISSSVDKAVLRALEQFRQNKDDVAIPVLNIFSQNENLTDSLQVLANVYIDIYNFINNPSSFNHAKFEERIKSLTGNGENTEYALFVIANIYSLNQNFPKAIEFGQRVLELRKYRLGEKHSDYALSLNNLALYYYYLGDYKKATELGTKASTCTKQSLGEDHPEYAKSINNLAHYYSSLGDYNKAIELATRALYIQKRLLGENHPDYATSLNNLANYFSYLSDNNKAIEFGLKALEIREKVLGENHPDYANSLNNLASYYSNIGNYNKAIELIKKAIFIRKQIIGVEHPDYATSLNNLANYYSLLGDYNNAIVIVKQALEIQKHVLGEDNPNYANSLGNLASYYSHIGDYYKAIDIAKQALEIQKQILGENHPVYATFLSNLANYYSDIGDYYKAIELGQQGLEVRKHIFGENNPDYASSLSDISGYYSDIGSYYKAIELGQKSLEIRKQSLGVNHPDYANSLNNLAVLYSEFGNNKKALEFAENALEIRKLTLGENHPDYANSLSTLASLYSNFGDYDKAIELGEKALEIRKQRLGENHPDYANSLNNLATIYSKFGDNKKAIEFGQKAIDTQRQILGENNSDYASFIGNMSAYYFFVNKYEESSQFFVIAVDLIGGFIKNNFSFMTENERTNYWISKSSIFYFAPNYFFRSGNKDKFSALSYNSVLFTKGLLLNSSVDLNKLLQDSGDSSVLRKFNDLHLLNLQLSKLYEKPINERKINTDSLEVLSEKLEKELVKKSKDYGDFTKNLTIKWTDVQQELRDNDVAIEFVDFPVGTDSTMYSALLLSKGWEYPKMVTLFEKKQMDKLISNIPGSESQRINMIYSGSVGKQLFDLVWKPLEEHIKVGDNVYFSATGVLHQIAIESLPTGDSTIVASDKYSLYRLSSTKQLVNEKPIAKDSKAVLYGGLKYDIEESIMLAQSQKFGANDRLFASRGFSLDSTMRGAGWNYLPGTKVEVQEISGKISHTAIAPTIYMDIYGNEESFKALSGKKNSIIHIASHGFFLPIEEARKTNYFRLMTIDENKGVKVDNSMRRSGLILSGGNRAWKGDTIPANIEDGILTAQEISALDLRGTNLLVLSACETGLGEVSGEGVFGLQRGFKKAGVQTIIMTLWKVNDVATKDMMNEFYGQLLSGKSKREAFTIAQAAMREKYKSPYYWAGFIMLD